MATLAIKERESDLYMAYPAVFPLIDLRHRILRHPFFYAGKYLRMAQFTSDPYGVLRMRENDVRHAGHFRVQCEVFLHYHGFSLNGNAFNEIGQLHETVGFSLVPVYPVPKPFLGKLFSKCVEIKFRYHISSDRVAPLAPLGIVLCVLGHARLKDRLIVIFRLPVMAGPAIEPFLVVGCLYVRGAGLHAECDINMAKPAGKHSPMQPMTELNGRQSRLLRIIIDGNIAILMRQRPLLLYACLPQRDAGENENAENNDEYPFHTKLLLPDGLTAPQKKPGTDINEVFPEQFMLPEEQRSNAFYTERQVMNDIVFIVEAVLFIVKKLDRSDGTESGLNLAIVLNHFPHRANPIPRSRAK